MTTNDEKILTANNIFFKFDDLERMGQELASYNLATLTYEEFTETVEKQGFDYVMYDSTITVTNELRHYISSLQIALDKARELVNLINEAEDHYYRPEQGEAKQDIEPVK